MADMAPLTTIESEEEPDKKQSREHSVGVLLLPLQLCLSTRSLQVTGMLDLF